MKNIYIILLLVAASMNSLAIGIVELPLPKSDKVIVKLMFRNGSICDPKGQEGITALTASLVADGGYQQFTSSYIKDLTYSWASRWYATVDKEVTVFTFEFHKDHTELFFPILTGLMLTPTMDESDFARIKSNQSNYVNQVIRASSDEDFSKMGLEDFLFRGTPYQAMVQGTTTGLESITIDMVKQHYKNFFGSSNLTIGIAGNYSPKLLSRLQFELNKLPEQIKALPDMPVVKAPEGINVEIVSKENAMGSAIFMGMPLPVTRRDDDFAALMVANSWLGEHRKSYSRLYQKIREQRSMNYGDYSYIEWYEGGGRNMLPPPGVPRSSNYFSIWLRPVQTAESLHKQYPELSDIKTGHAHFAIRMALREMQTLIDKGLSTEDFELTRKFLISYMKLYIQTPSRQLGYLMDSKFYNRRNYIQEMQTMLEKLTVDDVNTAIRKYWQTKNMYITIVTDDSEAEPLKASLGNNDKSPMTYSNALKATLPSEILTEDEVVSDYKLNIKNVQIVNSDVMFRK